MEMQPSPSKASAAGARIHEEEVTDVQASSSAVRPPSHGDAEAHADALSPQYLVYKRRFFGLVALVLLNIIVSWDWLTFSAVSATASDYFSVDESTINWLSTSFLFAFVVVSPLTLWVLNKGGPRMAIIIAAVLTLVGNWLRYAGTRAAHGKHFGLVMFGQIIIGFAQPFVLIAPTRYSNLWFSDRGRVSATAVASLANPLGGALGQLIGPLWATDTSGIPDMVLYTAIISSIAALPAFFIPARPPTPPSSLAAEEKLELWESILVLKSNTSFYLVFVPFCIYIGFFNAFSSLINQVLEPYGFSETEAGIAGGLLIVVGLVASAIVSPIVDRTKQYTLTIKFLVPLIAIGYMIFIWAPGTKSDAAPYVVCALIGASSFSLLPCALEYLVEITHPVSPEVSSTICWAGGQLLGAIFIIIMGALKDGWTGQPKGTMKRALVFEAVLCWLAVPFALAIGHFGRSGLTLQSTGTTSVNRNEV
ncbi:hypothetical protein MBLNU459_g1008t1 [Dothideomycetes sp. NU459]